jgi:dihydrofolate synthase/folylpolyglutamate synthase
MEMLGNTLPLIAAEKAGIIKMFVPVVVGEYQPEVAPIFQEKASEENAHLHFAEDSIAVQRKSNNAYGQIFDITLNGQPYLHDLTYQLQGFYQQKNLVTVIAAIEQLRQRGWQIAEQDIRRGLGHVIDLTGLKGRWQKIGNEPLVICDTGHNESGLKQVLEQIRAQKYEQLFMVIGVVREKDLAKFLQLLPQEAYYFFCQPSVPRGLPATELAEAAANAGLRGQVVEHPNDALKAALGMAKPQDFIFVGGSTFVVADIEAV